ncbi:signal peptidase I [Candidatus Gastranaerophilus sp. (ex Termes propinquus)]|nr:signal peptidase I [Candidatus Gastranaerophilus sp. (ex Termes propinquus)]
MREDEKKEPVQSKGSKAKAIFRETLDTLVFVLVAIIIIRFFLGELRWIPSGSMRPTLIEKDRVFVEKVTRWYRPLERGDIIVFYPPDENLKKGVFAYFARLTGIMCKDVAYIKRIVGMPGDKLEIRKNEVGEHFVYINDRELDEPYILSSAEWIECTDDMYCGPVIVPEDTYFMMGDNRGNSQDSRFWGFLPKERVIGRSVFIFWPLDRIRTTGEIKTRFVN